jgi:hypothetical protein
MFRRQDGAEDSCTSSSDSSSRERTLQQNKLAVDAGPNTEVRRTDCSATSGSCYAKPVNQLNTSSLDDDETMKKTVAVGMTYEPQSPAAAELTIMTMTCIDDTTPAKEDDITEITGVDNGTGRRGGGIGALQLSENVPYPQRCSDPSEFDSGTTSVDQSEEQDTDESDNEYDDDDVDTDSSSSENCYSTKNRASDQPSASSDADADESDFEQTEEVVLLWPTTTETATSAASFPAFNIQETISIEAFKQRELEEMAMERNFLQPMWIRRVTDLLTKAGLDVETSMDSAKEIVINGAKVECKADRGDPLKRDINYELEDIYRKYAPTNSASYQFLLIYALLHNTSDPEYEIEQKTCVAEMDSFCMQVYPLKSSQKESHVWYSKVENQSDVKNEVCSFFRRHEFVRAKNAIHAVIVFFGHGSRSGFALKDSDMNLDDINLLVKDEWRCALRRDPVELPAKVQIIYIQCFGYRFDRAVTSDRFNVISVTSKRRKRSVAFTYDDVITMNRNLSLHTDYRLRPQMLRYEDKRRKQREEAAKGSKEVTGNGDEEIPVTGAETVSLQSSNS